MSEVLRKRISCVLKTIVVLSALAGTFISAYAGSSSFMGGTKVFMYFTIQSNLFMAAIAAAGLYLLIKKKPVGEGLYVFKLVGTVAITLTGVVYTFVLLPAYGPVIWSFHNALTHLVVPVAAIADFFLMVPSVKIGKRNVLFVLIPPFLYAVYAGIGFVNGWEFSDGKNYPYFFLNWGSPAGAFGFTRGLPFMGTAWWIAILFVFLIILGYAYLAIAEAIRKIRIKKQ